MSQNNDEVKNKIGGGLEELPFDPRDFSHEEVFGAMRADELPENDFMVAPIFNIKDQGETDRCTAYATTAASEDQEGVVLDPNFTFFATKVLVSNSPDSWGANLRDACSSHVKYGGLEEEYAPLPLTATRDQILSPEIWDEDHKALAYEHRKTSFFAVDGPHDIFDNIRSSLWMHRAKMQSVITGTKWRPSWTDAPAGKIPAEYEENGSGHAFCFKGQRILDGVPHLVAQLSNGESIGDKGLFYFPREVVNKEFGKFGLFIFEDLPREKAENFIYYGIKVTDPLIVKLWKIVSKIIADTFTNKKKNV